VRWQFVGGLDERERKAFLFNNIVDGRGRKYSIPVVVGAIAANRAIYSVGMGVPVEEIPARWDHAIANPIPPRIVDDAVCHEVVIEGAALRGEGHGLDRLPIPISTPGFEKEYMERAKAIWEELGLPRLRPQPPWFGYSLGDWLPQWDEAAKRAVDGRYLENGRISEGQRRKGIKPETKFRPD